MCSSDLFNALNKATQVPPFPAGDLRTKQEFAAGHRWASVIDFAAGYYAVPLDDDTVPYVAFYVEGRGYYVYLRMPFGLTGAPATFCEMVAGRVRGWSLSWDGKGYWRWLANDDLIR